MAYWRVGMGSANMTRMTRAEIDNRPHVCCEILFASHGALTFHIMRAHMVRADMIGKCIVRCEMLAAPLPPVEIVSG